MLWVGERTRQRDGAHCEFLAGIRNPVGCKIGPSATPDEVLALSERLDPDRTPGRLTLITRLGVDAVDTVLPAVVARGPRERPVGGVGVRSHARQHLLLGGRPQDTSVRRHRRRAHRLLPTRTARREPGRAGSTSSSPVTTSPSAWAVWRTSSRTSSTSAIRRPAIRVSTAARRSTSPSGWRSCYAPDRVASRSGHATLRRYQLDP